MYQLHTQKKHKKAAGIVNGTSGFVKFNREIGWLKLDDIRIYRKLVIMFIVKNCMATVYLIPLFPGSDAIQYNHRNRKDFVVYVYPRRTSLFEYSFNLVDHRLNYGTNCSNI